MNDLIYRSFHGRITTEELARLRAWQAQSPTNQQYYQDFWRLLSDTQIVCSDLQVPVSTEMYSASTQRFMPSKRGLRNRPFWSRSNTVIGTAIAAGIAALVATLSFWGVRDDGGMLLGSGEIVTGAAEMTTVKLADGSIVRLAPSSRLRVSPKVGSREVWLEGRAYFAVAKHEGIPFLVRTHAGDALVLGTRFDLRARKDNLQLLVVEGAVNVEAAGRSLDVEASHVANVTPEEGPVTTAVDERYVREELDWLGDFLVFEATPLAQVAHELSTKFEVPVEVLDSTLAQQTVRGMFVESELESIVNQICQALSAYCSINERGVTISP